MNLYVIIYTHKHGTDSWARFDTKEPGTDKIIEELRAADEWDEDDDERGSCIEVRGPFDNPAAKALREVVDSYDDTGCESCGVIDAGVYEGARKALGL
jgi:hypothetical protein